MIEKIKSIARLDRAYKMLYILWWVLLYFVVDTVEWLLGRRDSLTPPKRRMLSVVSPRNIKNFKGEGLKLFEQLIEFGQLKPINRVLEVGCGIGRVAIPLTRYLNGQGSYEGLDIISDAIRWCNKNISPKYLRFRFQRADIYNKAYNPKGKYKASEYSFPYPDASFDFVFLTSVFTHLLPKDLENYFSQITRVLKRGGRSFITYFLLNAESSKLMKEKKGVYDFCYPMGEYHTINPDTPEAAVAYEEGFVRSLYERYGLQILEPIHYGFWCGRDDVPCGQDTLIAVKP